MKPKRVSHHPMPMMLDVRSELSFLPWDALQPFCLEMLEKVREQLSRELPSTVDNHEDDPPASLPKAVQEFTSGVKRNFADQIRVDPQALKREVVHLVKINLPPGPGRPCDEAVTKAIEMRAQGKPWGEIYSACIPDYPNLSGDMRQQAQSKLRDAVRSRRNTRRRRSNPHQ